MKRLLAPIRRYRDAPVGFKVAMAPAAAVLCLSLLGALALASATRMQAMLQALATERLPAVARVSSMDTTLARLNGNVYRSVALDAAGFRKSEIAAFDQQLTSELAKVESDLKQFLDDRSLDASNHEPLTTAVKEYAKYRKWALKALDAKGEAPDVAVGYITSMEVSYGKIQAAIDGVVEVEAQRAQALADEGRNLTIRDRTIVLVSLVAALVMAAAVSVVTARMIVAPLKRAVAVASAMSEGDFRKMVQPTSTDATGQVVAALGAVSQRLGRVTSSIRRSAEEVHRASEDLDANHRALAQRSDEISASIEQTASTLKQLSSTIRQSAESSAHASELASNASDVARKGGSEMNRLVATMHEINDQARRIAEITGVIDGIAFQTNILALNASVEAARAREHGRGFAVVAEEVRALAQRCADAARQVRALIEASAALTGSGTTLVVEAGQTMARVVTSIESVSAHVGSISIAAREQALGVSEMSDAVDHMERNSQHAAAMVQQASDAVSALRALAADLKQSVSAFKVEDLPTTPGVRAEDSNATRHDGSPR